VTKQMMARVAMYSSLKWSILPIVWVAI